LKKYFAYLLIAIFSVMTFSGCTDSYDEALQPTNEDIKKVKEAINETEIVAKDHNVTLSHTTETQIAKLEDTIKQIQLDSTTENKNVSIAITETINETFNTIQSVKQDILDSNISQNEKSKAIEKIEVIEREKLKEGLKAYAQVIETDKCEDSNDNTGTLPPSIPNDKCIN